MLEGPNVVESWGIVRPADRSRGLGSAQLVRHEINAGDRGAAPMLEARGLRPVRHFWHMGIDLEGAVEPGRPPEGIEIGGIEPNGDLSAVHAVLAEAFAEDWSHQPQPFDGGPRSR